MSEDVFSVFSSQKSFSLVLEALDYDNDTSESGEAAVCMFVCLFHCSIHRNVKVLTCSRTDKEERDKVVC